MDGLDLVPASITMVTRAFESIDERAIRRLLVGISQRRAKLCDRGAPEMDLRDGRCRRCRPRRPCGRVVPARGQGNDACERHGEHRRRPGELVLPGARADPHRSTSRKAPLGDGGTQLPPAHASQQLANSPTHDEPSFGALHRSGLDLVEHFVTPFAVVRQQLTNPGLPQVDLAAHLTTAPWQL
jgi:hypothetical protein